MEEDCPGSAAQCAAGRAQNCSDDLSECRRMNVEMMILMVQKGRGHLDPKKQPTGTETMGSPESKEEFPDRMKMDERSKLRKIHFKNIIKMNLTSPIQNPASVCLKLSCFNNTDHYLRITVKISCIKYT